VDATSARLYLREYNWDAALNYVTDNWYPAAVPADEVARWQLVNKVLRDLDQTGRLDQIVERWL
jgi:hypothetical protein